ncbi:bifunctional phosphopantothenoylcysteine decarboxylase/phosphopantothenate--cysteine ligase CoaBC [Candidatus Ichthyocystis hellenicum]|uniref:bifunctional phosphopantothenoylcysteine decarboxylase/phosphopantothenate--cysteine ligase CoaBC n=2 Tax=Candidatus Ichthyocystis TaxID=2929841 RepID=UPI000B860A85|nr:bifunctional phosphopantothenoylcysteine decarboxylase/phosphopantothenate--cysteine ligase CoaBC [Candidatus Ichthyocystis hellenicum]
MQPYDQQRQKYRVALGVTAGIAAYKSLELARIMVKNGWGVEVIMSPNAERMIHPSMFKAVTHQNVWVDDSGSYESYSGMPHIQLSRDVDVILVTPATADFIAKLAHGISDNLLLTTALARKVPLIVAPSMNLQMWCNSATQRNVSVLADDGVHIIDPDNGEQACGEYGMGRSREPRDIFSYVENTIFARGIFSGKKIMITAGPTVEKIDAVRCLTNRGSGKMGYRLAEAARDMGAEVTLISGPVCISLPTSVSTINVSTLEEMYSAVMKHVCEQDVFISAASVSDYVPVDYSDVKLPKQDELTIRLRRGVDILASVAKEFANLFCVGFCCETNDLDEKSERKRVNKNVSLIVGNWASDSIGKDSNIVVLYDKYGRTPLQENSKIVVARQIMSHIHFLMTATDDCHKINEGQYAIDRC